MSRRIEEQLKKLAELVPSSESDKEIFKNSTRRNKCSEQDLGMDENDVNILPVVDQREQQRNKDRSKKKKKRHLLEPRHVNEFRNIEMSMSNEEAQLDSSCWATFQEFAQTVCMARCIPRKELLETWAIALVVYDFLVTSHMNSNPQMINQNRNEISSNEETRIASTASKTSYRVADVASGHGLLSWALLVLSLADSSFYSIPVSSSQSGGTRSTNSCCTTGKSSISRDIQSKHPLISSGVSIDIRMPVSAERVDFVMKEKYKTLESNVDYVEASLTDIQPTATNLLVAVHCCGTLSDHLIDIAIRCGQHPPIALVPCCHSIQSLSPLDQLAYQHQKQRTDNQSTTPETTSLENFVDQVRIKRLENAGYTVCEKNFPSNISPKNRILLATRSKSYERNNVVLDRVESSTITTATNPPSMFTYTSFLKPFHERRQSKLVLPLDDTPSARSTIRTMAGRAAANHRKQPGPRILTLSLWVSDKEDQHQSSNDRGHKHTTYGFLASPSTLETQLQHLAESVLEQFRTTNPSSPPVSIQLEDMNKTTSDNENDGRHNKTSQYHREDGFVSRNFRVCYQYKKLQNEEADNVRTTKPSPPPAMTKQCAKELHISLCHCVSKNLIGVIVRQIPT